jgi:hypothetical protein
MLKEILLSLYGRDLKKLKAEIELYQTDDDLWKVGGQITNSGGNLCLHLIGNLKHYLGAVLGGTAFIRYRDGEFSSKDISSAELLNEIDNTSEIVGQTLQNLTDEDLEKDFAEPHYGETVTTGWMLAHLLTHFDYHLGQINYHRRFFQTDEK